MVLTVSFMLSSVTGLFVTVTGAMRKHRRQFDTSIGASGPHDFAVRLTRHSSKAHPRPPHPASRFVTIAKRLYCRGGTGELVKMICPTRKAQYFSQTDWTAQITLIRLHKSTVSRNGFSSSRGLSSRAFVPSPLVGEG
jgi:hypothetical protein